MQSARAQDGKINYNAMVELNKNSTLCFFVILLARKQGFKSACSQLLQHAAASPQTQLHLGLSRAGARLWPMMASAGGETGEADLVREVAGTSAKCFA